jgi:hypothetical protein
MFVYQLLYVSGATRSIDRTAVSEILATSRRNNAAAGITGMLLFGNDTFIQVLEGERAVIRKLVERIRADARHRNFMELAEREAQARAFPDWQMGFKELDPSAPADQDVFRISHDALAGRIDSVADDTMLDLVLAFAGRDFLAEA